MSYRARSFCVILLQNIVADLSSGERERERKRALSKLLFRKLGKTKKKRINLVACFIFWDALKDSWTSCSKYPYRSLLISLAEHVIQIYRGITCVLASVLASLFPVCTATLLTMLSTVQQRTTAYTCIECHRYYTSNIFRLECSHELKRNSGKKSFRPRGSPHSLARVALFHHLSQILAF